MGRAKRTRAAGAARALCYSHAVLVDTAACGANPAPAFSLFQANGDFQDASGERNVVEAGMSVMKAIVWRHYGSPAQPGVLECEEIERPAPGSDEVLIRVRAAAVNAPDWRLLRGKPYAARLLLGLRRPRRTRMGTDVAGQIEAVGSHVTGFKAGDEVFGTCQAAFADYACAAENVLLMKPASVSFEQAAAAPVAGLTALQGLRDRGHVRPGDSVLVNGASGGVGTFAVQMAKAFGAEVTAVCSTRNVDMVRSIGADRVIDYTREDFTRSGQRYDVVFDCVGNRSFSARRRVLTPRGICVMVGGPKRVCVLLVRMVTALVLSRFVTQRFVMFVARRNKEDLGIVSDMMETGKVVPVIDRRYPLSEGPAAIRYVDDGHARGKVIITVP
jgi:NADPH:quinone reductase-like Zn-dependent oxidoreductase